MFQCFVVDIYMCHHSNLKCRKIAVVTDTTDEWTLSFTASQTAIFKF